MRGLRHDMKSHLESIAAVIRKISGKDKEELDNYIEKMETTVSSKADKQLHGLGMENIQRCARKYMGGIDITVHNTGSRKKFNLTIMMYEKYFTP